VKVVIVHAGVGAQLSTKAVREQYIQQALASSKESYRVPFKDGLVLPVIEIPLDCRC
jgi:hypothetical protein